MAEANETRAEVLAAALEAIEDGIAVLDAELRVMLWNHSAMEMSGYRAADLLSRPLPDHLYEPERPENGTEIQRSQPSDAGERPQLVHLHHAKGHSLPA